MYPLTDSLVFVLVRQLKCFFPNHHRIAHLKVSRVDAEHATREQTEKAGRPVEARTVVDVPKGESANARMVGLGLTVWLQMASMIFYGTSRIGYPTLVSSHLK